MTRLKIILLCLILTMATSACGLKGPLYLPETSDAAAPAGVEAEQEEDDDSEKQSDETHP